MPAAPARTASASTLLLWMMLAIAAVTALAYWDARRESAAALDDFGREQSTLADALAAALGERIASVDPSAAHTSRDAAAAGGLDVLSAVRSVERAGEVRVLVHDPSREGLVVTDGALVRMPALEHALDTDAGWLRLSHDDAAGLGLPPRTAMAGVRSVIVPGRGRWGVAVAATARSERDREQRAQWRLMLSVVVASALVLAFGGLALRKQRKELELERELAIAAVEQQLDERLVRADKLATMGALATGIAHEVSTPLGVIVGRAEQLLPRVEGDERSKRAVEVITEQSERISRIIRGFLGLARGDSPSLERVAPDGVVRATQQLVEHRFRKAGVVLRTDVGASLPRIACQPQLFEQVLVNLLLNACDACERGGSVDLSVKSDGERVAFIVGDDGVGIAPEDAARAIEPFFTTKPAGKGTGLGLAIANEIVKHHCGTLTVGPRRDGKRGTRVCVEVPASPPSSSSAAPSPPEADRA